jgi:predicted alpha/beta-fold hydrolase
MKIEHFKGGLPFYYNESSCTQRLHDIKIPLFFLSALDDPILGNKTIPIDKCYENILLGVTKAGGHIGYFEGLIFPGRQWFPEPTFEFLNFYINKFE